MNEQKNTSDQKQTKIIQNLFEGKINSDNVRSIIGDYIPPSFLNKLGEQGYCIGGGYNSSIVNYSDLDHNGRYIYARGDRIRYFCAIGDGRDVVLSSKIKLHMYHNSIVYINKSLYQPDSIKSVEFEEGEYPLRSHKYTIWLFVGEGDYVKFNSFKIHIPGIRSWAKYKNKNDTPEKNVVKSEYEYSDNKQEVRFLCNVGTIEKIDIETYLVIPNPDNSLK